jgi:molybdopterin-guanine dinucleotide biosynthesis protein A
MDKNDITAIVLAGGRGTRMGGVDKGLQLFNGRPLALQAKQRLASQVGRVIINANRNLDAYRTLGCDVYPDDDAEFAGPLSGFAVGLAHCETPYLLTVPCDSPRFPIDLAHRLAINMQKDLEQDDYDIAMAAQGGWTQPVFCLIKRTLLPDLLEFMASGKRKIDAWTAQHKTVIVNFDEPHDDPLAFANVNTLSELSALQQQT